MAKKNRHQKAPRQRITPVPPKRVGGIALVQEFGSTPMLVLTPSQHRAPKILDYACSGVWAVEHSAKVEARFLEVAAALGGAQRLYHGTAARNVQGIAREGLVPGRSSCMFGAGIYLGSVDKAFGYASGMQARYMFEVEAVLGRILRETEARSHSLSSLQAAGFDSVMGVAGVTKSWNSTLLHSEHVVYSPDQVLPRYLFEYHRVAASVGRCSVMIQSNQPIPRGQSAFRDILQWQRCDRSTHSKVYTTRHYVNVCDRCMAGLRVGSKLRIKSSRGGTEEVKILRPAVPI